MPEIQAGGLAMGPATTGDGPTTFKPWPRRNELETGTIPSSARLNGPSLSLG
jgi:hypothetical protein